MLYALAVTTVAGLSTGLGALVVLLFDRPKERLMAFSLGFAAGVMMTVSLSDMLPHAVDSYSEKMSTLSAALCAASLCMMGMLVALLLEKCVPNETANLPKGQTTLVARGALRSAMVTTVAIILHNLPEGILTLFTSYANPKLGLTLAIAIALHNIPEGIAVSVPIYYATGSRWRGILYALASGLAEPVGAVLAFFLLKDFLTPMFLNGMIAFIAGIMLFVSVSELMPQAFSYRKRSYAVSGICFGILVMGVGMHLA